MIYYISNNLFFFLNLHLFTHIFVLKQGFQYFGFFTPLFSHKKIEID